MGNDFGQRLKKALKEAGYSQKSATEELGLSKNAITNYVAGRIPEAMILYKLSKLCSVSMEWLLTGEENTNTNTANISNESLKQIEKIISNAEQSKLEKIKNSIINWIKNEESSINSMDKKTLFDFTNALISIAGGHPLPDSNTTEVKNNSLPHSIIQNLTNDEKKLIEIFRQLSEKDQQEIIAIANVKFSLNTEKLEKKGTSSSLTSNEEAATGDSEIA